MGLLNHMKPKKLYEAVTQVVKKTGTAGAATALAAYLFS